jgi:hypothetical protein
VIFDGFQRKGYAEKAIQTAVKHYRPSESINIIATVTIDNPKKNTIIGILKRCGFECSKESPLSYNLTIAE